MLIKKKLASNMKGLHKKASLMRPKRKRCNSSNIYFIQKFKIVRFFWKVATYQGSEKP